MKLLVIKDPGPLRFVSAERERERQTDRVRAAEKERVRQRERVGQIQPDIAAEKERERVGESD